MDLESRERARSRTIKFLSGVFRRGRSDELKIGEDMLYGTQSYHEQDERLVGFPEGYSGSGSEQYRMESIGTDLESLHLSRADNPYLSSCEALADPDESSLSPTPGSPRAEDVDQSISADSVLELHSHLIRSPPPMCWNNKEYAQSGSGWTTSPLSPSHRSADSRAFSPESGSDGMETERSYPSYSQRSHSEERMISPCPDLLSPSPMSPVRGQTPAYSPMRGRTPDITEFSPPGERMHSTPSDIRIHSPRSMSQSYHRSMSHSGYRTRSRTPDEEFSPSRFNIYTLHYRSMYLRNKSESSYLVTSSGGEALVHYQPASRRSLAHLSSRAHHRKSSTDFLSWLPSRRSRSQNRNDAKSLENIQSSHHTPNRGPNENARRLKHKSLTCVGGDSVALVHGETVPGSAGSAVSGPGTVSPRPSRRFSVSGIKKSLSLKHKKSHPASLYVDINNQDL